MHKSLILFVCTIFYSCDSILKNDDLKIVYYPDSEVIKQSVEYQDGKKNGYLKMYYRNGNPKVIQKYLNDTITDSSYFYHENGLLSAYQIFVKGKKTDCWKKFNKKGKEYWSVCFKDNRFDGPSSEFSYNSLHPLTRSNFVDGRKEGKQETFHANGKPKSIVYYEDGFIGTGTEEWTSSGTSVDNDFKIIISEKNEVLMKNKLSFFVQLENPKPDDMVYEVSAHDKGRKVSTLKRLSQQGNTFLLEYTIQPGAFVMEEVHLAAFRKTAYGNTYIKKTKFKASANSF